MSFCGGKFPVEVERLAVSGLAANAHAVPPRIPAARFPAARVTHSKKYVPAAEHSSAVCGCWFNRKFTLLCGLLFVGSQCRGSRGVSSFSRFGTEQFWVRSPAFPCAGGNVASGQLDSIWGASNRSFFGAAGECSGARDWPRRSDVSRDSLAWIVARQIPVSITIRPSYLISS